jgi:hypothetical protein
MTAIKDANILSVIKPLQLRILAEIKHKPYGGLKILLPIFVELTIHDILARP